jgi:dinuclear metal center YbgI/SA1388 family protein
MRVADLVLAMEAIAPPAFAESWDNVGLVVGDRDAPLTRVLVAVDLSPAVFREIERRGCDAAVAYHPPVFQPVRRLLAGDLGYEAARRGLAVYSPHTALDVAEGGTNDVLADVLNVRDRRPLRARVPGGPGIGRVGEVAPVDARAIVASLKACLRLSHVLAAGDLARTVTRVAVCAGAGGALLDDVVASGAQLYVAGELAHHDALRGARAGLAVACTLHSNTERAAMPSLARRLREHLLGVDVQVSEADVDPFTIV